MGAFSHPEHAVRHSYPLAVTQAGFVSSLGLLLQTLPYALVRFGVLFSISLATILWLSLTLGGYAYLSLRIPLLAYPWAFIGFGSWGYVYWFIARYFLYLLKSGHIAVLTELITQGQVQNGQEDMFRYGTRIVKERFGEVNAMFVLDALVKGVVGAFNRTLNFIGNLLPIPGLSSMTQIVSTIVRAATTYIDETLFSYSLARGDDNKWRSAQDGLIYYAQNHQEILKTSVGVVLLDWLLSWAAWIVCLAPAAVIGWFMPVGWGQSGVVFIAILVAANVRAAFLKPLFLIMIMVKYHVSVQNQPINLEWDARLNSVSDKFRELKDKAIPPRQPKANEGALSASPMN